MNDSRTTQNWVTDSDGSNFGLILFANSATAGSLANFDNHGTVFTIINNTSSNPITAFSATFQTVRFLPAAALISE